MATKENKGTRAFNDTIKAYLEERAENDAPILSTKCRKAVARLSEKIQFEAEKTDDSILQEYAIVLYN